MQFGNRYLLFATGANPVLMTCPDCLLECTIDEESVDTFSCPGCGLLLYSRSGESEPAAEKAKAAIELSAEDLERTRHWQASLDEILPTPDQLPRRLGRYELVELLGEGSFAQVYRALDGELGRDVALKIPSRRRFTTPEHLKRFVDEARMAAKLEHPNIVRAYDIGWLSDDVCFIAMEYCAGGSLDQLIKSGPVPPERTAEIIADAAEAIHFAHLKGLVHRDLKPSNIMFGRDGRPRIVDFGLALPEEEQYGKAGEVAGTLPYMSPEQVRGDTHHLDGRSDIWSLGIILYQMLAGRRPFVGARQQLVGEILNREPKPLRQVIHEVPKELEEICLKCLSKPVVLRWATAHDVAVALQTWLDTRHSAMLISTALPNAKPQTNSRRWLTLAVLLGLLMFVVIPFGGFTATVLIPRSSLREVPREWNSNWIDQQPLLLAVPLLNHPPKKLAWPKDSASDSLDMDLKEARLSINSQPMTLTELGETQTQNFRLDAQIFKTAQIGWSGIFWGFQMDSKDPLIGSCHAVYFRCDPAPKMATTCSLELSHLKFKRLKSGSMMNVVQEFSVTEAVDPPAKLGDRLEIWVHDRIRSTPPPESRNRIAPKPVSSGMSQTECSINWTGRPQLSLTRQFAELQQDYERIRKPDDPPFPAIRASGSFGILNRSGSTLVRNAQFTLLSRPQP